MDEKYKKIEQLFYGKCIPLIFPDFNVNLIDHKFSAYSSSQIEFEISPNVLYNCTNKYSYNENYFEHFTSFKSLINILNSNTLRMYNMSNLKDKSEYLHATPKKYHDFLKYERDSIYIVSGVNTVKMNDYEIFNLWEKYGEDGFGAKIKFELDFSQKFMINDVFLKKVVYENLNLTSFLSSIKLLEKSENVRIDYKDILSGAGILHKHSQYTLENEIRLGYYNKLANDSIEVTPNLDNPFFEDFSYSSKKVSKYRSIKINCPNEIFGIKIIELELGYKHQVDSEAYLMINRICMENHGIKVNVSGLENI